MMLYHEVQESKLCAVHCVNTVLQGPFFSEFDLAALASDLDFKERQMLLHQPPPSPTNSNTSHNVSLDGDFSIQVLQKALEVWDLEVVPLNSPVAAAAQAAPENENAFICHLHDHWFTIRKVNGEWYNFNSLLPAPQHLSKFYLAAYIDSLKNSGWSIFLVRGNFPRESPFEASNGFGQWLSREDAERITKSSNNSVQGYRDTNSGWQQLNPSRDWDREDEELLMEQFEDEDLKAAIAASLMDSSPAEASGKDEAAADTQIESGNDKVPRTAATQNDSEVKDEIPPSAVTQNDGEDGKDKISPSVATHNGGEDYKDKIPPTSSTGERDDAVGKDSIAS